MTRNLNQKKEKEKKRKEKKRKEKRKEKKRKEKKRKEKKRKEKKRKEKKRKEKKRKEKKRKEKKKKKKRTLKNHWLQIYCTKVENYTSYFKITEPILGLHPFECIFHGEFKHGNENLNFDFFFHKNRKFGLSSAPDTRRVEIEGRNAQGSAFI